MRFLILALLGIFTLGAPALAQPRETVQARLAEALSEHEAAHAEHEADREAWLSAMAAYPPAIALEPAHPSEPVAAMSAAGPSTPAPIVEERLGFGITYLDDGGCNVASKSLTGSYARETGDYDVSARVRTAPSGGDCERNATSFALAVERRWKVGGSWSAVAKFAADRRSTSAPYAIVDAHGDVLTRADGAPSDPVTLPAGAADTIGGVLGVTTEWSGVRLTVGGNIVPVDWAREPDSIAGHVAVSWDYGSTVDVGAWADIGRDWYGAARASWRPAVATGIGVEISAGYDWGLRAVDDGAPFAQTFAGLPVHKQGPARDHATTLGIGITF